LFASSTSAALLSAAQLSRWAFLAMTQDDSTHCYRPIEGYVPDEKTAVKIALAVWEAIYGQAAIAKQAPHKAVLIDGAWVVSGTLPRKMLGGVALAEISKEDGKILRVSHGR
jgi:NTF2 fold immunity protein